MKLLIYFTIRDFFILLDENLGNRDTLNPIQEEDHLTEDQEKSESCADNNTNKDAHEEDDENDTNCQFPDTQIRIDLSGPK